MLLLGVCLTQPCMSAGRNFAAAKLCVDFHRTIGSFPQKRFDEKLGNMDFTECACWFQPNPNKRAYSMEYSSRSISSNFSLWKRTKKVCSISNVIFTRPNCGQRSSRAVGSKLRAVAFYLFVWIWYVFSISKCRGESGVGLCMTLVLVKRMQLHSAHFWFKPCLAVKFVGSRHCAAEFSVQVLKSCRDLHPTVLYILIFRTPTKFIRKNKMLPLGVCFLQPCSSDCRVFAASRSSSHLNCYWQFVWFTQRQIQWFAL